MINEKASQRHRVVLECGVLIQPLRALKNRPAPPTQAEYRLAIAQVRGGDPTWRNHVNAFTTFARDVECAQEFQDISHVPERLWGTINGLLESPLLSENPSGLHSEFATHLDAAEKRFLTLIQKVPIPWQPAMFDANTPFTSYLRIREVTAATEREGRIRVISAREATAQERKTYESTNPAS